MWDMIKDKVAPPKDAGTDTCFWTRAGISTQKPTCFQGKQASIIFPAGDAKHFRFCPFCGKPIRRYGQAD